jgi:sulfate transport system permease protein
MSSIDPAAQSARGSRASRYGLRTVALVYLALVLVLPIAMVFYRTFENGLEPVVKTLQDPMMLHALYLTVVIAAIVVPLNTVFGVFCALLLVRRSFPARPSSTR